MNGEKDNLERFKKFEEWAKEQGIADDLKRPYYLPDLRVAFIEGMLAAEKIKMKPKFVVEIGDSVND